MINTIFYFVPSMTFEEYLTKVGTEIADRTIVFATQQKSIYRGGTRYGSMSLADFLDMMQTIFNENPYILPVATTTTLGGIIVGKYLTIDSNGSLAVNTAGLFGDNAVLNLVKNIIDSQYLANAYVLPTASPTTKGGVKIGSGLSMSGDTMSVDFSAITGVDGINGLDGLLQAIFNNKINLRASKSQYGIVKVGDGINVTNGVISVNIPAPYDDTSLRNLIDADRNAANRDISSLRDTIASNVTSLNQLINQFDDRVNAAVGNALDDASLVERLFPDGGGGYSNFGQALDSAMDEYLQIIGAWEVNPTTGQKEYKWSKIQLGLQSLETTVGELQLNSGGSGGTTLTSTQLQDIRDIGNIRTAVNSLSANYAEFEGNNRDNLDVVRWLSSALDLYANLNATWADLASVAKNKATGESAIAALTTRVTALESGIVSDAALSTLVQNKVDQLTTASGFVTTSSLDTKLGNYATATQYATLAEGLDDLDNDVASALQAASMAAAGVQTSVKYATDSLGNIITDSDGNKKIEGTVRIWADDIYLNGLTAFLNAIGQNLTVSRLGVLDLLNEHRFIGAKVDSSGMTIGTFSDDVIYGTKFISLNDGEVRGGLWHASGDNYRLMGDALLMNNGSLWNTQYRNDSIVYTTAGDPNYPFTITSNKILLDGDVQINGTISSTLTSFGGGSSSVDWSDITNAPSFNCYSESETDSYNNGYSVSIHATDSTSSGSVSITASGNGTVFVGGNDTTVSADNDILIDADNDITISASHDLKLSATYSITADKEITTSSDERLKNIKSLLNPDIAEIAKTRIVSYQYKDNTDNTYLGTIAQDWENIFPDAVKDDKDGYKTFAYQSAALASAVTAAREIVKLKAENADLKQRLDVIEAKIAGL